MDAKQQAMQKVFTSHDRAWRDFAYVYAVISRRSRGLSIGVNLNVDQVCNFDCVYCMVPRQLREPHDRAPAVEPVSLPRLGEELRSMVAAVADGSIWREQSFCDVADDHRRLNDIAFSGDGEPTAYPRFDEACRLVAAVKAEFRLDDAKIVLITNATLLDRPHVQAGLAILDQHGGEVWAKLDAGTQAYYHAVDRTRVPLAAVLANIASCGRVRTIVIQTMLLRMHGQAMPDTEFAAYSDRLSELRVAGCRIDRVQLYTVARHTAETWATPLDAHDLEARAASLRTALPGVTVEIFPGVAPGDQE
jgi:wyosine [tRNA(Phe)-imidazoG37] synthetase (radical SAM superfamily)